MHEVKRANSDDLVSIYFVRTGHVARIEKLFFNESLLHNLRHSHTKRRTLDTKLMSLLKYLKLKTVALEICSNIDIFDESPHVHSTNYCFVRILAEF